LEGRAIPAQRKCVEAEVDETRLYTLAGQKLRAPAVFRQVCAEINAYED
jgi:hypothetical protein